MGRNSLMSNVDTCMHNIITRLLYQRWYISRLMLYISRSNSISGKYKRLHMTLYRKACLLIPDTVREIWGENGKYANPGVYINWHKQRKEDYHLVYVNSWVDCSNHNAGIFATRRRKPGSFASARVAFRSWQAYLRSGFIATFPSILFEMRIRPSLFFSPEIAKVYFHSEWLTAVVSTVIWLSQIITLRSKWSH